VKRALTYLLAAGLAAVAGPIWAAGASDYASPAMTKVVRDTDRGVRAKMRYFPEVITGGSEMVTGDDGQQYELNWDGVSGLFEAELLDGATLDAAAADGFMREAIAAVCPSANVDDVFHFYDVAIIGPFLSIYGQCPAIDAKVHQ